MPIVPAEGYRQESREMLTLTADLSIGGMFLRVARIRDDREHFHDVLDPPAFIDVLRGRADLFTFWQRPPCTAPMHSYPYEWDNVAAIPVATYDDWFKTQIPKKTRVAIRKATAAGIVVRSAELDDAFVDGLHQIFHETRMRQGRPYPYFGLTHGQIREAWARDADCSRFLGAYVGAELVGFVKLLTFDRYTRIVGTVCKLAHRDKAPMNALIDAAVRATAEVGRHHLVYGKYVYGTKGEDSLTDFKRYNGFVRMDLPRYWIALTVRGQWALRWGLHQGLRHRVPPRMLRWALRTRARWNAWRA